MGPALKATAEALAGLRRGRTSEQWASLAFQEVRDKGPLDEVEDRMVEHLSGLAESAATLRDVKEQARQLRQSRLPADVEQAARDRIRQAGGLTSDLKAELGIPTEADKRLAEVQAHQDGTSEGRRRRQAD